MTGVGTGALNIAGPDLPMEERETGEQLRARMEAKARRSFSPWANRPTPPKHEGRSYPVVPEAEERFVEPAPRAEPLVALAPEPVAPAPVPKPAARPAVSPQSAPRPSPDAAGIVQDYLAGQSLPEIAAARSHSKNTVRAILRGTPGLVFRDDRASKSGSTKKAYDPAVVDAVRKLYLDDELSQSEVAERLGLTVKVVCTIMARHDIPGRPGQSGAKPGLSTLAQLRADIAATGLSVPELRTWATKHGITVGQVGIPSRTVLDAYLAALPVTEPSPVTPEQVPVTLDPPRVTPPTVPVTHSDGELDEAADVLIAAIAEVVTEDETPAPAGATPSAGLNEMATAIRSFTEALVTILEAGLGYLDDELGAMATRIQNGAALLGAATTALDDLPAGQPSPEGTS